MTIPAVNISTNESVNPLFSETKYISYSKISVEQNQVKTESSSTDSKNEQSSSSYAYSKQKTAVNTQEPSTVVSITGGNAKKSETTEKKAEQPKKNTLGETLTTSEQKVVDALKKRDTEVRQHEQAHMTAGQGIVLSGPTYEYQTGPDGKQYAIGGEVKIDTSMPSDPEEAVRKARKIKTAALAPSEPSSQDMRVSQKAQSMEQTARQELARVQSYKKTSEQGEGPVDHVTAYNNVPNAILGSESRRVTNDNPSVALKTPAQRVSIFSMINGDLKINPQNIIDAISYNAVSVSA